MQTTNKKADNSISEEKGVDDKYASIKIPVKLKLNIISSKIISLDDEILLPFDCNNVGHLTEMKAKQILENFINVKEVIKDRSTSKIDLYYTLNGENVTRGLQIKSISQVKSGDFPSYQIPAIGNYVNGMLIVALNKELGLGLAYLNSDIYNKHKDNVTISPTKDPRSPFSKILLKWDDFIIHFQNIIHQGMIVTAEIFKNSMPKTAFIEYESIERFSFFCQKYGWNMRVNAENSSATDVFVGNLKIQMKYSSKQRDATHYYHLIHLRRLIRQKPLKIEPYKKGDNDFYIIEIGSHHGDFLILPEQILVDKQIVQIGDIKSQMQIGVFPYGYLEQKLLTVRKGWEHRVKGNWTMNPKYWFSTEKGHIDNKLQHVTLENIRDSYDPNDINYSDKK